MDTRLETMDTRLETMANNESTPKKVVRPDLSAKLERLKRGLVADTVRLTGRQYPSLRDSQINYGIKSGCFGAYDPLRKRSKMFRIAVSRFAPPYYFWHKEFINSMKLKPLLEVDQPLEQSVEDQTSEFVSCVWCKQLVGKTDYEFHRIKRCKRKHEFLGNGYYRCSSCNEGFLDQQKARHHISLHFPTQNVTDQEGTPSKSGTRNLTIICRDQAKRKKWL